MAIKTSIVITAEQRQAFAEIGKLVDQVRRLGPEANKAGVEVTAGFSKARQGIASISQQLAATRREILGFFSLRIAFGLARDITTTAVQMESLTNAMHAVKGSGEAAAQELAFVRAEADRLGINLQTAIRQFVAMTAAAQGTSLEGEGVREIFSALAEAAVVLGLSQEQLEGAFNAVQQMMSKGTVAAEEMRGQLGERLYGAFQIAARAIGLTTAEFSKLLEQGLVPADRFLRSLAPQLRKEFGAGVSQATQSARAEIERFNNALLELKTEFATSGFLDALASAFRDIAKSLGDPEMKSGIRQLGAFIGSSIRYVVEHAREIGIFAAAVGGAKIGASVGSVGGVRGRLIGGAAGALVAGASAAVGLAGSDNSPQAPQLSVARRRELLQRQIRSLEAGVGLASGDERTRLQSQLAAQRKRLDDLAKPPETASTPTGGIDPFFRGLLGKGGGKGATLTRLPTLREEFNQSAALIKDGLERESQLLQEQLADNLVSIRDHYRERERIAQASFDSESSRIQAEKRQQEEFIAALQARRTGADPNQQAQIDDQVAAAKERIKRLETELIILGRQRATEGQANSRVEVAATRTLADEVERLKLETQELLGVSTPADRRMALELQTRQLREQLRANAGQFPEGEKILDRAIDVKAKTAEFSDLERQFNASLDRMRNAEQSASNRRQAGIISESQARLEVLEAQRKSAAEVERLIPRLNELGAALGPDVAGRVGAIRVEFERLNIVVDDVAVAINGAVRDSFQTLFEDIARGTKSAKDLLLDFVRSIEQAITKIASQKLADQLFGGTGSGGAGGLVSGLLSGKLFSAIPGSSSFVGPLRPGEGGFLSMLGSFFAGIFHRGGIVGAGGAGGSPMRRVDQLLFAAAPRMHMGGLAGNEIPAILERGEEVLTRRDPRHRMNGGGAPIINVTFVTPDHGSFRRSRGQWEADLAMAVRRGQRSL